MKKYNGWLTYKQAATGKAGHVRADSVFGVEADASGNGSRIFLKEDPGGDGIHASEAHHTLMARLAGGEAEESDD